MFQIHFCVTLYEIQNKRQRITLGGSSFLEQMLRACFEREAPQYFIQI